MPDIVLKRVPEELHRRLKEEAQRNHRSMNRQAIALIEEALAARRREPLQWPPPIKTRFPITKEFIDAAKREGRP